MVGFVVIGMVAILCSSCVETTVRDCDFDGLFEGLLSLAGGYMYVRLSPGALLSHHSQASHRPIVTSQEGGCADVLDGLDE